MKVNRIIHEAQRRKGKEHALVADTDFRRPRVVRSIISRVCQNRQNCERDGERDNRAAVVNSLGHLFFSLPFGNPVVDPFSEPILFSLAPILAPRHFIRPLQRYFKTIHTHSRAEQRSIHFRGNAPSLSIPVGSLLVAADRAAGVSFVVHNDRQRVSSGWG